MSRTDTLLTVFIVLIIGFLAYSMLILEPKVDRLIADMDCEQVELISQ